MCSARDPVDADQLIARGRRDREKRHTPVEQPQRQLLEQRRQYATETPAELPDVQVPVGMMDESDAGFAQPQRGEEHDPVDDLEHDVGIASEPAQHGPRGAGEDGAAPAHPMHDEVRRDLLNRERPGIGTDDERDVVTRLSPADEVGIDVRAGATTLRVGPIAIGEHEDAQRGAANPRRRTAGARRARPE